MKKLSFFLLLLFFASCFSLTAFSQTNTQFDQLVYVNKAWLKVTDADPAMKTHQAAPLNEGQLIQQHLRETEKLLRSRQPSSATAAQKASRLRLLDFLHKY